MRVPDISFQDYLEAKAEVDDLALNSEVRRSLLSSVRELVTERHGPRTEATVHQGPLRVLDLGTGSGVMVRRMLRDLGVVRSAGTSLEICGVDLDAKLVEAAGVLCLENGSVPGTVSETPADSGSVQVEFRVMSVEEALSTENSRELITAHALMDLLPLAATCAAVRRSLVPGGLFYATINYNGLTRFYPQAVDAEFEQQLLAHYDQSMRRVRDDGCVQDGAASGGRLYEACEGAGLEILALGGSDWCVFPKVEAGVDGGVDGGVDFDLDVDVPTAADGGGAASGIATPTYTEGERRLLSWMLRNIYNEGVQVFATELMDSWMRDRLHSLQHAKLAMVVHHLDLLARRELEVVRPS